MTQFKFIGKSDSDYSDTILALSCIKNIFITEVSENIAFIEMSTEFFEIFSHSLEYWGIIELI